MPFPIIDDGMASASPSGTGMVCPVTSPSRLRASASMQSPSAAGPTISPNTAPASTEASCSGSPTRISRAAGRTASATRAIIESDTIDVSSITTTSSGRWLLRLCRNRVLFPGLKPRSRCSVVPSSEPRRARTSSPMFIANASPRTASSSRAAALPVGAANAMRGGRAPAAACLFVDQSQDPGHRRGLPGARSTGDHRHVPQHRCRRRQPLEVWDLLVVEQPGQTGRQHRVVDAVDGRRGASSQVGGHKPLVRPRAGSGRGSFPPSWSGRSCPTTADSDIRLTQSAGSGQGSALEIDRRVAVRACGVADGVQIDTHVTQARTTRGERHAEPHDIVHCAAQAGQAEGDVDVGRCQDPSHVERVQQTRRRCGRGQRRSDPNPSRAVTSGPHDRRGR